MNGAVLEVEFKEVGNEEYTEIFVEVLKNRFNKELSKGQMEILAETIETARLEGLSPMDLAINLGENFEAIFS